MIENVPTIPTEAGPLAGLRVVDLSTVFAAPYIGGLLSDLGAEVIKVEAPNRLDQTRGTGFGPYLDNEPGDDGWNWSGTFHSLNRGKRSIVLDLKQESARGALRRLLDSADVLLENFTPRVMRGWGMTYTDLAQSNPRLIMLSNTGYGSTGPWSSFKAQGTTLEATMGLTLYTGYEGEKPKKVVQSYPDFLAAWTGLFAVHTALYEREHSGRGQWIDLAMYQLGCLVIPEALIACQADVPLTPRIGNREHETVLSGVYACAGDDDWVAIALVDATAVGEMANIVGVEADDELESTALADLEAHITRWAAGQIADEAAEFLQSRGIPAAKVARIRDLLLDPQLRSRSFFEWIEVRGDQRPVPGTPYTWSAATTVKARDRAPLFGEDTVELLTELEYGVEGIRQLYESQATVDRPLGVTPKPMDLESLISGGVYRRIDPEAADVLSRARSAE